VGFLSQISQRIASSTGDPQASAAVLEAIQLFEMEHEGTGRVRLNNFYSGGMGGDWKFTESVEFLRNLGALDETDSEKPRVIIANYISSPSNCIASSSFYSVCCMDECEGLLGHLERQIAAPEGTPARIGTLVSELSSSSVVAPRKLSATLNDRLGEIAATHGGSVPLHGRLFAQWMHHAFPRECPYPHLSGTTNPQTPDEWLESTGEDTTATSAEMQVHVDRVLSSPTEKGVNEMALPWSPEEELLVAREAMKSDHGVTRNAVMFMAVGSIAFGMVRSALAPRATISKGTGCEKYLV